MSLSQDEGDKHEGFGVIKHEGYQPLFLKLQNLFSNVFQTLKMKSVFLMGFSHSIFQYIIPLMMYQYKKYF
jgi:hypothetical protein